MNIEKKILGTMTIIFVLGGNFSGFAVAETEQSFEGFKVEDGISLDQLPPDVQYGSIKLSKEDNEVAMAKLATFTLENAVSIARRVLAGNVVEAELEDENGFLVWDVEMFDQNGQKISLIIDAGNGHLLAAELDEKDYEGECSEEEYVLKSHERPCALLNAHRNMSAIHTLLQ